MPDVNEKPAVILFADFVGSARLSEVLEPKEYDKLICVFQDLAAEALEKLRMPDGVKHIDGGVRGDELVLIMVIKNHELITAAEAAKAAIRLAVDLNTRWFIHDVNRHRVDKLTPPHRLAFGFHYGPVYMSEHPRGCWSQGKKWTHKKYETPEGYAINFAKRVEDTSRNSNTTNIAMSQSFFSVCRTAGLPIVIGDHLQVDMKGFELKEPVYELISQDIVTFCPRLVEEDNVKLLEKAFARDPVRTLMLMELGIETHFITASKVEDNNKSEHHFDIAIDLAETAANVIPNPGRLLYRAARCYHRKGDLETKNVPSSISIAISYYDQAIDGDSNLIWAANDAASAHWKLGTRYEAGHPNRRKQFEKAKDLCCTLIKREPRHFYAYNLRALIAAELVLELKHLSHIDPGQSGEPDESIDESIKELIEQAESDLERARSSNQNPGCLYFGTRAHIEFAKNNYPKALSFISTARKILGKALREGTIPAEFFYQRGFAVVGFQPPRPEKLEEQWAYLEKRIKISSES